MHWKTNTVRNKFRNICVAYLCIHCTNNAIHSDIDDIHTEATGGAGGPHSLENNGIHKSQLYLHRLDSSC